MTPLEAEIRRIIDADGPMTVSEYMQLCLAHPRHGYYMTRNPLGRCGDFITAPEVSQMFGELLGAWAAAVWRQMGAPRRVRLVELGPGRGTLMADALRAAKTAPDFRAALSVHLVEISPVLRERQQQTLAGEASVYWHDTIDDVPDGPIIALANEFIDALPVHQFVKDDDGWHLRVVGTRDDRLTFMVTPFPLPEAFNASAPSAPRGTIFELRDERPTELIAQRIVGDGGAALIIDYGEWSLSFADTLQAVRDHRFADPLADPGEADLTTQVSFSELAQRATQQGATVQGPLTQGEFLRRLGIERRAARLKQRATATQAAAIDAALARLTGEGEGQMGRLFKAIAFAHPALGPLPGFDS